MKGMGEHTRKILGDARKGISGKGTPSIKVNTNSVSPTTKPVKRKMQPRKGEDPLKTADRFAKGRGYTVKDGRTGKNV